MLMLGVLGVKDSSLAVVSAGAPCLHVCWLSSVTVSIMLAVATMLQQHTFKMSLTASRNL
jgi:hypothetical protein